MIASSVTAVGSTVVGVTAILVSWRSTRATLRQQKLLIAAEKLWERRADTYVELIKTLNVVGSGTPNPIDGRVHELSDLLSDDFLARLSAYDGGAVCEALNDHLTEGSDVTLAALREKITNELNGGTAP
jgi:hypothetical protein